MVSTHSCRKHYGCGMIICAFLIILLISILPVEAQNYEIIGSVLTTDIKAFINGVEIPAYNIDGNMVIVGADLRNYGFSVVYDNDTRSSNISLPSSGGNWSPLQPSIALNSNKGEKIMDVYSTDINVYVNGIKVIGYNVDGKMAFRFSELKVFGTYNYDNTSRTTNLNIEDLSTYVTTSREYIEDLTDLNLLIDECKSILIHDKNYHKYKIEVLYILKYVYDYLIKYSEISDYIIEELKEVQKLYGLAYQECEKTKLGCEKIPMLSAYGIHLETVMEDIKTIIEFKITGNTVLSFLDLNTKTRNNDEEIILNDLIVENLQYEIDKMNSTDYSVYERITMPT